MISAGEQIGRYKIRSAIGKGGMGEVFLAEDSELERLVALKVLPEDFANDAERMRRFVQEAKSASALNHPNIITIYEIGKTDNTHFIATEYIEGETLHSRLRSEPMNLKSILDIAIQVASALDAAHRAGIIHRDIKPENVMIRPDGFIKLLDFGIAKLTEKQSEISPDSEGATAIKSGTMPGMIIGTANYMSPEQARGQAVDARTDIFSFGVVLYQMIAGHLPFEGETAMEMIGAILKDEPKSLDKTEVTPELEKIIGKCLRKDRNERYQTIKDVLIDVQDVKRDLEFQDKLERTVSPEKEEPKTQILHAATADGINQTITNQTAGNNTIKNYLATGLAILLVSTVGFFGYQYFTANHKQIESIAVMPFVNASGNSDVEYLSDGMTETLIKSLSNLPNLNVKARSSVFRYKGKDTDAKTIGQELNVQAVLNGRVVQRGEQLTLNLELIDAQTENVIWSEQYNRKQPDLVSLQSEIARDVSSKLKSKLSGADVAKIEKEYTANPEAYQLYLKGRYQWNKRTTESLRQAVEFYQQAIEKDPKYALAYSGLAESYVLFSSYSVASGKDSMPQAKAAAQRALELDESVAEAHTALGFYLHYFEFDRVGSEREYRRAIELNPNYATAYQWLGSDNLVHRKRFDEAVAALRRAEELDPLSPIISMNIGSTLVYARRYDEAVVQLNRTLSLDPNFSHAHFILGWAFHYKGMYAEAIAEYRRSIDLAYDPMSKAFLALSLQKQGRRAEVAKLLDELKQESERRYVPRYALALAYIALNEKEDAFVWLEKEIEARGSWSSAYAVAPELDELRDDPRFKAMLKRMNLPE